MAREIDDFITGLETLAIAGVTMLGQEPDSAPAENELPVGYVRLPTMIGGAPLTAGNSAIRPMTYRALLVVLLAPARQYRQKAHYDDLLVKARAVRDALDAADFGFRLSYEVALDTKLSAGAETFYGIAAVVSGAS